MILPLALFGILGAALLRLPTAEAASQTDIYVDPTTGTTNSSCWSSGQLLPCRTLDLALLGAIQVNEEGSVAVHLLPSEHYSITNSYNFVGRNGFQLNLWEKSAEQFVATVSCSGALAGLAFFNSTSITIENVKFKGCAGGFSSFGSLCIFSSVPM